MYITSSLVIMLPRAKEGAAPQPVAALDTQLPNASSLFSSWWSTPPLTRHPQGPSPPESSQAGGCRGTSCPQPYCQPAGASRGESSIRGTTPPAPHTSHHQPPAPHTTVTPTTNAISTHPRMIPRPVPPY